MSTLEELESDPKNTIIRILNGPQAFIIARDMLFIDKTEWHEHECENWQARFSEADKQNAKLIIYKKKMITKYKIGIRLYINNKLSFGELRPEKQALKRWQGFL